MIYQYELSDCHKCTTVVGDVDDWGDGGGVHVYRADMGTLDFHFTFPVNLKLL